MEKGDPKDPQKRPRGSKRQIVELLENTVITMVLEGPQGTPKAPKSSLKAPKIPPGGPKSSQKRPREPKKAPRETRRAPKGAQESPQEAKRPKII